jgi:hypothetical protein
MKMSTITMILSVVILGAILFFIMSKTSISFKPFSFKLVEPLRGAGWLLLVLGISLVEYSAYEKGKEEIIIKAHDTLDEIGRMQEETKIILKRNKDSLNHSESILKSLKENEEQ